MPRSNPEQPVVSAEYGGGVEQISILGETSEIIVSPATAFQVALAILSACTEITGKEYTVTAKPAKRTKR
jgi:predicted regulator of Ras-like GTPase activity (Roadblock/LC7/MglB family)